MHWLSFLGGITAAWVFMGIFIFLLDLIRKPKINEVEMELLKYWRVAETTAKERNEILDNIQTSIIQLKK